ncbi:uncharacterized protein IUM83_03788 [Phytophthora cinnamomi]|uniref:uncharacterized protein n=1 Tax=Phytophthora cinnamomi TaxID=4785 RepID=UPI00355988A5|nr:hypothetical protein IUM83_03788 [Phytophthora cinnamomi]
MEHVLKFLGNQTLTKLQALTGDCYAQCEPDLTRFNCKYENDNTVMITAILHVLCRGCEAELPEYMARTTACATRTSR